MPSVLPHVDLFAYFICPNRPLHTNRRHIPEVASRVCWWRVAYLGFDLYPIWAQPRRDAVDGDRDLDRYQRRIFNAIGWRRELLLLDNGDADVLHRLFGVAVYNVAGIHMLPDRNDFLLCLADH